MTEDKSTPFVEEAGIALHANTRGNRWQNILLACVATAGTFVIPMAFLVEGGSRIALYVCGCLMVICSVIVLCYRAITYYQRLVSRTAADIMLAINERLAIDKMHSNAPCEHSDTPKT
jgi:hypothetical protein